MTETMNNDAMEPISCEAVFEEWSVESLEMLANEKGLRYRSRRNDELEDLLVSLVSDYTRGVGIKMFCGLLDMVSLEQLCAVIPEKVLTSNGKNSKSKTVYAKRLSERVLEAGSVSNFLRNEKFSREDRTLYMRGIIHFLGEEPVSTKSKGLARELEEALDTFCLTNLLNGIPASFLQRVCEEMRIWHGNCSSSLCLAECIIEGKHYEPTIILAPVPLLEKKPKNITRKVGKADLQYWFTANELKAFLDENNLKSGGKKTELAQRIVDYFDPEKENDNLIKGSRKPAKKGRKKRVSRVPDEPLRERKTSRRRRSSKKSSPKPEEMNEDPMDEDSLSSFSDDWSSESM